MQRSARNSQSWHHPSQHDLMTVERLTRLEVIQAEHVETIDEHAEKHDAQDVWNKAFSVALAGLGAGLAHAKATDVIEAIQALWRVLRP